MKKNILIIQLILILPINCFAEKNNEYIVIPKSGLILRSEPNRNSDKLELIPENSNLIILEKDNKVEKIGNSESNWYLVEYNGKKGWIFGAYIRENLDIISSNCNEETYLKPQLMKATTENNKIKTMKIHENSNYEVGAYSIKSESKILFKNKNTNKNYLGVNINEKYSFKYTSFPNLISTDFDDTGESDFINQGSNTYILMKDRMFFIPTDLKNQEGLCIFNLVASYNYAHKEIKELGNEILILTKYPECNMEKYYYTIHELQQVEEKPNIFIRSVYATLNISEDSINYNESCSSSMPNEFSKKWNKGKKINTKK